jgi:hypothetical protein
MSEETAAAKSETTSGSDAELAPSGSAGESAAAFEPADGANLSLEMPAAGASPDADGADLEHGFFSRGLSEEHLLAASERQGDQELFGPTTSGRRRRIAIGFCGVLVLTMVALGVRSFVSDPVETPGSRTPLSTVTAAAPAAAPVPSPESIPNELVPPIGSLQRVATVDQLRARVPEGPTPEGAVAAPAVEGAVPAETAAAVVEEEKTTEKTAEPAPAPAAAPSAAAAPSTAAATGPSPAAPAPAPAAAGSPVVAPAVVPSPQVAACTGVLRSGRFRDIESKCKVAFQAQPAAPLAAEVAQAALELGRNADAAAWARRAIGVDPKHADAFVLLGGAEQQLGHSAEARAAYSRYLELAPNGQHAQDIRALLPRLAGM